MRGISRIVTFVVPLGLAAIGVIALAGEVGSPKPRVSHAAPPPAVAALAAAATALPTPDPTAARVIRTRVTEGEAGVTRLVFEMDRAAEHLETELPDRAGVAVRILGATAQPVPAPITPQDGLLERVSFTADGSDLLVRIESKRPIRCRAFALQDPARIVLDVDEPPAASDSTHDAPLLTMQDPAVAEAHHDDDEKGTDDASEPRFEDFLAWIDEFRREAEAAGASTTAEDKATHWKALARLLAQRGLYDEADRTLTRALAAHPDLEGGWEDSLRLAEIRIEAGHSQDALPLARKLSPFGRSTEERLRLAHVLAESGAPVGARAVLEEVMPRVPAEERAAARLLLARCLWDSGAAEKSLNELEGLSREERIPTIVDHEATVLRADCLFALGRLDESKAQYMRAARFDAGDEESAWIRLQLGHVAHREGRFEDAKTMYREASEKWPDTFYATQAAWFLETAERLGTAWAKKGESGRG